MQTHLLCFPPSASTFTEVSGVGRYELCEADALWQPVDLAFFFSSSRSVLTEDVV